MTVLGIDYQHQPLYDAWWTPGWTAQNDSYIDVSANIFEDPGFPGNLTYVFVTANLFDSDGDPVSGFYTFFPSSSVTITEGGVTTILPQRLVGYNETLLGLNQFGSGKIYLWHGQLMVRLLATDNSNMNPASFTYHVKEHFLGGQEYDISVPSANTGPVDIHSLIIPSVPADRKFLFTLAASSTEYVSADISAMVGGASFDPTAYPVNFTFMSTPGQPSSGDWHTGQWANNTAPYIAEILIGPANGGLVLSTGIYTIWAQVVTSTQVPVLEVGTLQVY